MDVEAEQDREMLGRIAALYLGLAALAMCAACRCLPVRFLVLWYLRRGEGVALQRVAELGSWPLYAALAQRCDDSVADAARLARLFRTAARAVRKKLRRLARLARPDHPAFRDVLKCAGAKRSGCCPVQAGSALALPQRLDSS